MSIAKAISATKRPVTATTGTFGMGDFWTGSREYNVTGWHVRPLHHGAQLECIRAHLRCQGVAPLYESPTKPILKWYTLKSDTTPFMTPRRLPTSHHESIGVTPSPPKSVDTFWRSASPRVVVTFLMPIDRRFRHEDRTSIPGVPCQPDCG